MSDELPKTVAELTAKMDAGWRELEAYITTLNEEQMTVPTDAAGWTVKDHLMHLAVWAEGMTALLNFKPRYTAMNLEKGTWDTADFDTLNDIIFKQYQVLTLAQVLSRLKTAHRDFVAAVKKMADEDLMKPYPHYQKDEVKRTGPEPIIDWIVGDSYNHYEEHRPWIAAIVARMS